MSIATAARKPIAKVIKMIGNDLTLRHIEHGVYDEITGMYGEVEHTYLTKALDRDYISEHSAAGDMMITFVIEADYDAHEIDAFDMATYLGTTRSMIKVKQVSLQNTTIIYQAVLTGDAVKMA